MKLRNRKALLRPWLTLALLVPWASPALGESTFDQEIGLLTRLLAIQPGSVVADIGAGGGEFAIAISRGVGAEGRVYATELAAEDRAEIEEAAGEAGADRVVVAEARIDGTGLPPASCDGAFLRGVFHHVTEPEAFLEDLFATIRPGGRLLIVDFPPAFWLGLWTPKGIPESRGGHGILPELLISEIEAAGFVRLETIEKWPTHNFITKNYAVAFERP